MKLYSKTAGRELDVETIEKEQDGQVLTVIKHASLMDIIYNQLEICKDPDCIKIEDARPNSPYPVYRCTIWDKEKNRCAVGIGSGKPETLTAGIASDYADESASNRAFDRAAITYLQFPGRNLSEEEVGIFSPIDLTASLKLTEDQENNNIPETPGEIIDSSPVEPIVAAPIGETAPEAKDVAPDTSDVTEEVSEEPFMDKPAELSEEAIKAGDFIINFGKYSGDAQKTVKEICSTPEGIEWADKCMKIAKPAATIKDGLIALRTYRKELGI